MRPRPAHSTAIFNLYDRPLKSMDREDRRWIGENVKLVEYGWRIGMPICRAMGKGLHKIRTDLANNRIALDDGCSHRGPGVMELECESR